MPDYRLDRPIINGKRSDVWYVCWTEARRSRRQSTGATDKVEARRYLARLSAIQDAPPERFFTQPQNEKTRQLLGQILHAQPVHG